MFLIKRTEYAESMDENIRVPPNDEAGHIVRARFEDFLKTFDLPVQESDHGLQG